jgi:hypothetical protein
MPLDSTFTPMAAQAVIMANATAQQNTVNQGKSKRASGVELKQVDKTNELYATPDQAREMRKRD